MKWWIRNGDVRNPELPFWSKYWKTNYVRVPRLVDFYVDYYGEEEYRHPILEKNIDWVVSVTGMIRESTRSWDKRQRLSVRKQIFRREEPEHKWSPVKGFKWMPDAEAIGEVAYAPMDVHNRKEWRPVMISFLFTNALIVWGREWNYRDPAGSFPLLLSNYYADTGREYRGRLFLDPSYVPEKRKDVSGMTIVYR